MIYGIYSLFKLRDIWESLGTRVRFFENEKSSIGALQQLLVDSLFELGGWLTHDNLVGIAEAKKLKL